MTLVLLRAGLTQVLLDSGPRCCGFTGCRVCLLAHRGPFFLCWDVFLITSAGAPLPRPSVSSSLPGAARGKPSSVPTGTKRESWLCPLTSFSSGVEGHSPPGVQLPLKGTLSLKPRLLPAAPRTSLRSASVQPLPSLGKCPWGPPALSCTQAE